MNDELESLRKQQAEARRTEIYIPMTTQESADFDSRQKRISRICAILSQHDFER